MSWTSHAAFVAPNRVRDVLLANVSPAEARDGGEPRQQLDAAIAAVEGMLASGAFGQLELVTVTIAADHTPGFDHIPFTRDPNIQVHVLKSFPPSKLHPDLAPEAAEAPQPEPDDTPDPESEAAWDVEEAPAGPVDPTDAEPTGPLDPAPSTL